MMWSRLVFSSSLLGTALASSLAALSIAEIPRPTDLRHDTRLRASLLNGQIYQPDLYAQAITVLDKMDKKPSCHRLATLTLIESCQTLEVSSASEVELFEIRSEFGIRLALCEMEGAANIPPACADFRPGPCSVSMSWGGFFKGHKKMRETSNDNVCYAEVTTTQVQECRRALNGKTQDWMSYSNNMQNLEVVCQASRNAIEQAEILRQFKEAAIVGNDVTETVANTLRQSKDFLSSLQNLQARVLADWEAETIKTRFALGETISNIQATVHSMIETFRQDADDASGSMEKLKHDIQDGQLTTEETTFAVRSLHDSARTHYDEMSVLQVQAWENIGLRASEIGSTLSAVKAGLPDVVDLVQTIVDHFQESSHNISTLHAEMEAKIEQNNEKLIHQDYLIGKFGIGQTLPVDKVVTFAACGVYLLKNIRSWSAILVLIAIVSGFMYQFLASIPFIHLSPIQFKVPSSIDAYSESMTAVLVKVLLVLILMTGVTVAVVLVCKQHRRTAVARDLENMLPRTRTGLRALPFVPHLAVMHKEAQTMKEIRGSAQPVPPSSLECDLDTLRSFRPQPQTDLGHARRDFRAGSAPP
ncbi:hypothetical protein FKW77_007442 [Venturia effusa]|uniref:Karyogamy protein 5 n=1 Tax=Venturia effusa TaxID=50376 RepID=A0A517L9K2_9PEZI|nr:hypothetical protein FKW77_007442 [Venturia effusa]